MLQKIELEKAQQLVKDIRINLGIEKVSLMEAHGRVLAQDITSPVELPPFNRSPLDGYALIADDTTGANTNNPIWLEIIDTVYAGDFSQKTVGKGFAVRLMTGSPIPEGANCVIRQEDTCRQGEKVGILKQMSPWDNYCFKGEDFKNGDLVLNKDTFITAIEVGVLAGIGMKEVTTYKRPTAAVISTGDELMEVGETLTPGKIYNSNLYTISYRLKECGVDVVETAVASDNNNTLADILKDVIAKVDFVITTGGVSVGDKDLMKDVLESIGAQRIFWKINMKPGSPILFSVLSGKPVFSLSGNPMAALVNFELLVRPFLHETMHNNAFGLKKIKAVLQTDFTKKSPIRRLLNGKFENLDNGYAAVRLPDPGQSPGKLGSMLDCNCYIDVKEGSAGLREGDIVDIIIIS